MAKIKVKGNAKKEYTVDVFKIMLIINANGSSTGSAATLGEQRTEKLLSMMKNELNITPDKLVMNNIFVRQSHSSNSANYEYCRTMSVKIEADMGALQHIIKTIEKLDGVSYSLDSTVSDIVKMEREVLKLAIEDSRQKAEMIAEAMGQKIVGSEEVNFEFPENRTAAAGMVRCGNVPDESLASQIGKPVYTISKEINIIWNAE